MKRGTKFATITAAAIVLAGAVVVWRMLSYGFSAHDEPTQIEVWIARTMRHFSVPAELRARKNPVPPAPEVLANARAHWADHCASCHGNDGRGKTAIGQKLYPKAPDMTLEATQSLSDGELFAIIENGVRLTGMPGWGDGSAASARGSWELVHLIRHLPKLTREEIEEMERLNPRSPAEFERMRAEEEFLEGNEEPSAHQH